MKKILSIITIVLLSAVGFLQYEINSIKSLNFGATIPTVVALFETSLASSVSSTATSMTLVSGTDKAGTALSGTYGFIIDEGSASEEFVLCTVSTTALTSCTRGISVTDGKTAVTALQKTHRRGASIKVTNYPQLAILSRILNGQESLPNIMYYPAAKDFTTASSSVLVDKNYVDTGILAGCANGSETVKGCSELATVAEINAGTGLGGSAARLFINPSYLASSNYSTFLPSTGQKDALAGSSGTPGAGNLYITADDVSNAGASGKIVRLNGTALPTGLKLGVTGLTMTASASGDLIVKGSGNFVRLASAGADGYALISSSSFVTEMTWRPIVRWEYIGSVATGDTSVWSSANITAPTGAKAAIVTMVGDQNENPDIQFGGEVTIFPTGKTSGTIVEDGGADSKSITASWNPATNKITISGPTNVCQLGPYCTAYFYK